MPSCLLCKDFVLKMKTLGNIKHCICENSSSLLVVAEVKNHDEKTKLTAKILNRNKIINVISP